MGQANPDKQPNVPNLPYQFNCDVLTGDGLEIGKPVSDDKRCNQGTALSSSTANKTNRFAEQPQMIAGRFLTLSEAANESSDLTRLIDPKLFDVDSPDRYRDDDDEEETLRNISPKSDGIPTEPITPMTGPVSKAGHRTNVLDMPDIAQNSVEDQLVKSNLLMETILSKNVCLQR